MFTPQYTPLEMLKNGRTHAMGGRAGGRKCGREEWREREGRDGLEREGGRAGRGEGREDGRDGWKEGEGRE